MALQGEAKVVSGTRGIDSVVNRSPSQDELPRSIQVAKAHLEAQPLKEGERLYVSGSRRYVVQLTCPTPISDPGTGHNIAPRAKAAHFAELGYLYRTNDPKVMELLEANRLYGIEFWNAEEKVEKEQKLLRERLLAQYKKIASPKDVAELQEQLTVLVPKPGQTEIALPKRERQRVNGKFVKADAAQ